MHRASKCDSRFPTQRAADVRVQQIFRKKPGQFGKTLLPPGWEGAHPLQDLPGKF